MTPTTEAPEKIAVTFVSRISELRLVRIPEDEMRDQHGRVYRKIRPGSLDLVDLFPEDDPHRDGLPWTIEFRGNTYVTDEPTIIDFIRTHRLFGAEVWEQGAAPDEERPTLAEQTERLTKASLARDRGAIQALLDEERSTHNRTSVTSAAEAALRVLGEAEQSEADGDTEESEPSTSPNSPSD